MKKNQWISILKSCGSDGSEAPRHTSHWWLLKFWHVCMTLCSFLITILATIAATTTGLLTTVFNSSCILFASYKSDHKDLTVDATACDVTFVGEILMASCTLLLTVWFVLKTQYSVGRKVSTYSLLIQLIVLAMVLLLATICGTIITAGLRHSCDSYHAHINATSSETHCNKVPVILHSNETLLELHPFGLMMVVKVAVWMGAALVLILLVVTVLLIVIHQSEKWYILMLT